MSNPMIKGDISWAWQVREYFREVEHKKLSGSAFLVLVCLWIRSVPLTGLVSASYREIMVWTGLNSKDPVRRSLEELIAKGYVHLVLVNGKPGRNRLYKLTKLDKSGRELGQSRKQRTESRRFIKAVDYLVEVLESGEELWSERGVR